MDLHARAHTPTACTEPSPLSAPHRKGGRPLNQEVHAGGHLLPSFNGNASLPIINLLGAHPTPCPVLMRVGELDQ